MQVEGRRRYFVEAEDEPALLLSMFCVKCNKKATSFIYQVPVTGVHVGEKRWYKNVSTVSMCSLEQLSGMCWSASLACFVDLTSSQNQTVPLLCDTDTSLKFLSAYLCNTYE